MLALSVLILSSQIASAAPPTGDAVRGAALYQSCTGCHSLDDNEVGPKHRGVVGRRAAAVPGYSYSTALRKSGLTWDRATLMRWLANPQKLVPGSKMYFSVADSKNRTDIVTYLAKQR